MRYELIKQGLFIERLNRFEAIVEIAGQKHLCHVKNTGRCKELLLPNATVYVQESLNPKRKTRFSLITVDKKGRLINMDSQAPNKVFQEALESGKILNDIKRIKPESVYGDSRFDFYVETKNKKIYIEVKGVTLEKRQIALFPDAPTQRGIKHIEGLCKCRENGYETYIVFIIQMQGVQYFTPNYATHPEFGQALQMAQKQKVNLLAYDCIVTRDSIDLHHAVPIHL